jgi:hypothetical protein
MVAPYVPTESIARSASPMTGDSLSSAVSWSAVLAGAATIAALSLILLILGVGLGLSSVSPWVNTGVSAATFGVSTILWLTLTQAIASAMGGYLSGRMRVRWLGVKLDEVYFRDTAHGFLAWAIATIATAALMTTVISAIVSGGAAVAGNVVSGAVTAASAAADVASANGVPGTTARNALNSNSAAVSTMTEPLQNSAIESLFRIDPETAARNATASSGASVSTVVAGDNSATVPIAEVSRMFARSVRQGSIATADLAYLSKWVMLRTNLSQQDAEKKVTDAFNTTRSAVLEAEVAAKRAADSARKASAKAALWLFVSLLIGAFVASFAAIYGGRERDR